MDPTGWGAALGGLVTIATAILAWIKYRRSKRDRLQQAQADEMRASIDHPSTPDDKLFLGKPKT